MDLTTCRAQIDAIDKEIVRLFQRRMELAGEIGAYKKAHGMPILQPEREQEKLAALCGETRAELAPYLRALYERIFELSRAYQA